MPDDATLPEDLRAALKSDPRVEATWASLTPISRRDYVSWIKEAKQAETRAKRIRRCCESLLEGKRRPCCYAVVPMDLYKALGADAEAKAAWSKLTADEKRDFSDWVEASEDRAERKARVEQSCAKIKAGSRQPA